ncbi:MAG: hypothetical protein SVV03_04360 [Candidatus Nanohaloarchaea archaeon]|nr:hypothetical protein [Candidatus Nanohaloarchaea archaeon]
MRSLDRRGREMRKGVSPLVSYILLLAVVIAGIGIIITAGRPILEESRDTAEIDQAKSNLLGLDRNIRDTASLGRHSSSQYSISLRKGRYKFNTDQDLIFYTLETGTGIISANSSRNFGNLVMNATGSDPWKVYLELNYTSIDLTGMDRLSPGLYTLQITNKGISGNKTQIEITEQ